MSNVVKKRKQIVVLDFDDEGAHFAARRGVAYCHNRSELDRLMKRAGRRRCWISIRGQLTDELLRCVQGHAQTVGRAYGLVTLEAPRPQSVPALGSLFRRLVGTAPDSAFLPFEELLDVLGAPRAEAESLFIAGAADLKSETVALTRGDLKTLLAPFAIFTASGAGARPDFTKLSLTDYGHTVRLGDYEASADAILYEIDPQYRRRLNKRRLAEEKTFGASLRRLRLQRKLSREDFPPLAAKTIARIERGEIGKPHGQTLEIIARRLGVDVDEIESY